MEADDRIFIAGNDVRLEAGLDLADVTQAGSIETGSNQILHDVSLTGANRATAQPGAPASLTLNVFNGGPTQAGLQFFSGQEKN